MPQDVPLVDYDITELSNNDKLYKVRWKDSQDVVTLRTRDSKYHGKGLFCAQELIPKGTRIDHYHGETMTYQKAHRRYPSNDDSFWLNDSNVVVPNPHIPGRYINDCVLLPSYDEGPILKDREPNVKFVEKKHTVIVTAILDIHEGEELLVSYGDWYWRGVLFEKSGFENAPNRFQVLTEDDERKKRSWLMKLGMESFPENLRLVKVLRHSHGKKRYFDYYLLRKGSQSVWRSAKQYLIHMEAEANKEECTCECCASGARRKSKREADPEQTATPVKKTRLAARNVNGDSLSATVMVDSLIVDDDSSLSAALNNLTATAQLGHLENTARLPASFSETELGATKAETLAVAVVSVDTALTSELVTVKDDTRSVVDAALTSELVTVKDDTRSVVDAALTSELVTVKDDVESID